MIKKSVIVVCFFTFVTSFYSDCYNPVDSLVKAIEERDTAVVERLLKRKALTSKEDKERFFRVAEEVVERCENSVLMLESPKDLIKFVGASVVSGVSAVACGLGIFAVVMLDGRCVPVGEAFIISGLCFLVPGLYKTFQAGKCPQALVRLKQAEIIEDMVKSAPLCKEESHLKY